MAKVKTVNNVLDSNLNGVDFNNTASQTIFSFGKFQITSNFDGRREINYNDELSSFVKPITLETLNLSEIQTEVLSKTATSAVLNLDKSDLNTFVRYGSAYEFLRVTIESIILSYPASVYLNSQVATNGNVTFSAFTYNSLTNTSSFRIPIVYAVNQFGLIIKDNNLIAPDNNEIKNLNLSYDKYVIWTEENPSGNSFNLIGFTGYSANNSNKYLTVKVKGNPFPMLFTGNTVVNGSGSIDFHIKPNNLVFEEFRVKLSDYEKYILSQRDESEGFIFTLKNPTLLDDGTINYSDSDLLWTTSDKYNIDISGAKYRTFLESLLRIGSKYDTIKTNLIARYLTPTSLKTYDFTEEGKMTKLLKLYGREFDEIRQFIDSLVNINKLTYNKVNNIPDQLISNLARTFGWEYFSLVNENEFIESILTTDDTERNLFKDLLPAEIDIELWRRILLNTNYFWKSKGTRNAIKSIFLMIGIPEPFINITEYVYTVDGKINPNNVTLTPFDFPSNSLPYDDNGYPIAPVESNEFYFQISGNSDSGQAYMDNFRLAGFNLNRTVDNKKSWIEGGNVTRQHYSTYQYYQEDSKLVLNTKEVDVALDTARGIEYDVYDYIQEDFKINSSGYTLPFNYVNISLGVSSSQSTFTLPYNLNEIQGDFEVRYNGILLNAPKTGDTGGTGVDLTEADYEVSGNTFTLSGGNLAYNNSNRRDVIQATLITSGGTQPISGISIQYLVTRIKPDIIGTTIPLPSDASGDVQVTINGIALTKGTSQFNADYVVNPNNASEIIIQNPDVISHLSNMNQSTTNAYVQVAYVNVTGSTSIAARNEVYRIDSFSTSKLFFNSSANKYVYKLNYKTNNVENIKVLINGIALEPNKDYALNPLNPFEVYLPKGLKYGNVISIYYLIAGDDFFNPVISDVFGLGDISDLSFLEFLELVWRKMINARSRKTITDFKGGWYPTLLNIYDEYLRRSMLTDDNPLQSNGYTFENLYPFLSKYNSFFQKFITQLLPATIILGKSGLLVRNSLFSKQKFTYKRGVNHPNNNRTIFEYLGDGGSVFKVLQKEGVVVIPEVQTIESEDIDVYAINNTGGENIVMFESVESYGMEIRLGTSGSWTKQPIPAYDTTLIVDNFSHDITGLSANATYQYRAFIVIQSTEYYGEAITITTLPIPIVTPSIDTKTGTAGFTNISGTGGENIKRYGDIQYYGMQYKKSIDSIWILSPDPLTSGNLTVDNFTTTISGLDTGTEYDYRARMVVGGIVYTGETKTITTKEIQTSVPNVDTQIQPDNAIVGTNTIGVRGNRLNLTGGLPITEYGTVYSESSSVVKGNPSTSCVCITGDSIANGTTWNNLLAGLTEDTTYYYKAYATNADGDGFGEICYRKTAEETNGGGGISGYEITLDVEWVDSRNDTNDGLAGSIELYCNNQQTFSHKLDNFSKSDYITFNAIDETATYSVHLNNISAIIDNSTLMQADYCWCYVGYPSSTTTSIIPSISKSSIHNYKVDVQGGLY